MKRDVAMRCQACDERVEGLIFQGPPSSQQACSADALRFGRRTSAPASRGDLAGGADERPAPSSRPAGPPTVKKGPAHGGDVDREESPFKAGDAADMTGMGMLEEAEKLKGSSGPEEARRMNGPERSVFACEAMGSREGRRPAGLRDLPRAVHYDGPYIAQMAERAGSR